MPCCGQKRTALKTRRTPAPGPTAAQPPPRKLAQSAPVRSAPAPSVSGDVEIEYLERSRIHVRGSETGRVYEFSSALRVQRVDPRDAGNLLGTRFFRRRA